MSAAEKRERLTHLLALADDLAATIHALWSSEPEGTELDNWLDIALGSAAKLGGNLDRARDAVTRDLARHDDVAPVVFDAAALRDELGK